MCGINNDPRRRAVSHEEAHAIGEYYARSFGLSLPGDVVCGLHHAVCDHCSVERPAYLVLYDLIARCLAGQEKRPMLRFSAFAGPGRTRDRYQSADMALVHDGFLKLSMSMRNVRRLQTWLGLHGLALFTFCSCGAGIVASADFGGVIDSAWYKEESRRRTSADQDGALFTDHARAADLPIDAQIPDEERDAYARIFAAVNEFTREPALEYAVV